MSVFGRCRAWLVYHELKRFAMPNPSAIPECEVVENNAAIQCTCPVCHYGQGYCETVIPFLCSKKLARCKTCRSVFYVLKMPESVRTNDSNKKKMKSMARRAVDRVKFYFRWLGEYLDD